MRNFFSTSPESHPRVQPSGISLNHAITWLAKKGASKGIVALLFSCCAAVAHAQLPSVAQLSQLKAMSPAEQQALAQQFGVDPSKLNRQGKTTQPDLSHPSTRRKTPISSVGNPHLNPYASQFSAPIESKKRTYSQRGKNELPIFGQELFQGDPDSLNQAYNVPVPAGYIMGPGDKIVVQLYGKENMTLPLTVNREGQVQFPNIGPVTIAGLTLTQAQELIDTVISERKVGVKASTTMGALRTIQVFVLGEVNMPGSFTVGSLATMINAIFASGGITDIGSLRNIQLKRGGKLVTTLDLYTLLLSGDTKNDSRLLPGDVIFVPPAQTTVEISGGINRPARYELNRNRTLASLVKIAGGLTNTSHAAKVAVTRINDIGERTLFNVDFTQSSGKTFKLQSGDKISIGGALDFINNQVTFHGNVKRPGQVSWRPGLRFTDIIKTPMDVIPGTDIGTALLQRMSADTGLIRTELFSPHDAWAAPRTTADPILSDRDEIYLFDSTKNRSSVLNKVKKMLKQQARFSEREQLSYIEGSVKFPGNYPLSENMTTQDLINLAGGLTESAYGAGGEITRYDISETLQREVQHINIDLQGSPVKLQAGDTLSIKQIPLWKQRETVTIDGEVMFPGTYTILPGETLTDVLSRAGGLTSYAYPVGAIFSRKELRKLEQQRMDELKLQLEREIALNDSGSSVIDSVIGNEASTQDKAALLKKLNNVKALGRMVIDLPLVIDSPTTNDFPVEDGDRLTVPRYKPSVTVFGEVQYPTSHFYNDKLNATAYIKRSGGTKKRADKKRIYIVKSNGRVIEPSRSKWFKANREEIAPGDTIVVPLDTENTDGLQVWATTTQIFYQTALGIAAIGRL